MDRNPARSSTSPVRAGASRRTFLAGSSAAVTAPLILPAGSRHGRHAEDEIRVGLIGCGGRGSGAAKQALSTEGNVRLVAMADAFSDRLEGSLGNLKNAKPIADRIDVPAERKFVGIDAYERLLAEADVDVVILATPPHFRPAHLEAAVEAGKHVFMEKPVAVDGYGIRQVLAAAEKAKAKNLGVGVGLQRHHQNTYVQTLKRIDEGMIGRVVALHVYWNMGSLWSKPRSIAKSDLEWQMRNWLYFAWLSGDHICEQHIHNLDVANWVKKDYPESCFGTGGRQVRTDERFGHIYDHHSVHYRYPDGTMLFSMCRQQAGCMNRVNEYAIGADGNADVGSARIERHDGDKWSYNGPKNNPYQTEHDDLFASIRAGKPYNEGENGAMSTLTAIMGRMATYTGKRITREEALASERLGPETYDFAMSLDIPPVPMPGRA